MKFLLLCKLNGYFVSVCRYCQLFGFVTASRKGYLSCVNDCSISHAANETDGIIGSAEIT